MAQNKGEEIIVGGNNDEIIALDGMIGRQYSDHPQYQLLVAALSTKKYTPLQKKRELVLKFRPSELDNVERYFRDPDLYHHFFRHLLDDISRNSLNKNQINKNLTQAYTAEMITDLYVLNEWNSQLVDGRRPSRSQNDPSAMVKKAFASLSELVGPVLVAYSDDQKKNQQKKVRSKVDNQDSGLRIQDTLPFDVDKCDTEKCPKCEHLYCMPTSTVDEVNALQQEDDRQYNRKLDAWNNAPVATRSKGKPRKKTSRCIEVACYCIKQYCGLRLDGGNCAACRAKKGSDLIYEGLGGIIGCSCDICDCSCKIKFPIADRRKLALKYAMEESHNPISTEPTNTASLFHSMISTTVQNNTVTAMQEGDGASVKQNAASMAAIDIFGNAALQTAAMRKTMQQEIPKSRNVGGIDIDILRAHHRAGRSLTVPPQHALTPNGRFGIASSQVTPTPTSAVALKGPAREQRFYRNKLSDEQLVPPSVAAARPAQSSISTSDDDSDDIEIIEPKKKEDDRKPAGKGTPIIIKRGRKRLNKMLHSELRKKEDKNVEKISKIKKAKEGLSTEKRTKDTTECFEDNEPSWTTFWHAKQ